MKRFILASGLLTALALAAVAAPTAPKAAKPAAHASSACGPSCDLGACPMKGSAASGTVQGAAVATNGNACPVSDPSLCPASCRPTQAGAAAGPAAKRTSTVVAAR
jgi:hypothetical protein